MIILFSKGPLIVATLFLRFAIFYQNFLLDFQKITLNPKMPLNCYGFYCIGLSDKTASLCRITLSLYPILGD